MDSQPCSAPVQKGKRLVLGWSCTTTGVYEYASGCAHVTVGVYEYTGGCVLISASGALPPRAVTSATPTRRHAAVARILGLWAGKQKICFLTKAGPKG
eukprot:1144388-Pelagomonas_calceolata.AAC.12